MTGTLIDTVRLREKGELTIPKKTREYFGLEPGDLLGLDVENNQLLIHKLETIKVQNNGEGNGGKTNTDSHLSTTKTKNNENKERKNNV